MFGFGFAMPMMALSSAIASIPTGTRPVAGDLVFGASPYRTMGNSGTTVAYAPGSGYLNETADNFLTAQPEGWRTLFLNVGFNSADSGGPTALEVLPGNTNTIDFAVTFTGAAGTGARAQATFGGATSVVMPDGGFAITDARPVFAGGYERVSLTTPASGKRATGWNADANFGEYRRRSGAMSSSAAAGGQIPGSAPDNSRGYKPAATLIPYDGSTPSILLLGDSITQQNDWQPSARMLVGGIAKGLGDPANGGSFGVGNFGHHGASMEDFMDVSAGSRRFSQRYAALAAIRDMNGGRWPMTHIWSQGLRNDFSGFSSPTTSEEALPLLKARAQAWWDFLAATFPGVPIIQSTVSARVTSGTTTDYSTPDGQEPRPYTAGIALEWFNDWLMTCPAPLAMAVDLRPDQQEIRSGYGPVWKRSPFTQAGGGTLVSALAAGTAINSLTIAANTAPLRGTNIQFEPGTSSMELKGSINTVTANSDGTYTLALLSSITPSYAHAAGAAIATAETGDGTHPEPQVHNRWATRIVGLKPAIAAI